MKKCIQNKMVILTLTIIMILPFTVGCMGLFNQNTKKTSPTQVKKPSSFYYDFGDVLIPKELKINQKASFIFRAGANTAGVMVLKGGVELSSMINFFSNNMAKDNWRLISTFKSPRTLMLFKKDNRWCIINITEHEFSSSQVEIWVAPTQSEASDILSSEPLLN
ncbi:Lipoprotein [Candidatus Magnetomoraceae bacterium gMMP-1]